MQDDFGPDILTLTDEEGIEHTFEMLDTAEYGDERYIALLPINGDEAAFAQEESYIIMRVGEEDGEEVLDIVEDDEELFAVGEIFDKRFEELYFEPEE